MKILYVVFLNSLIVAVTGINSVNLICYQNCNPSNPQEEVILRTLCDYVVCPQDFKANYTIQIKNKNIIQLNTTKSNSFFIIHANAFKNGDQVSVDVNSDNVTSVIILKYEERSSYQLKCIINCPIALTEKETMVGITCVPNCLNVIIIWELRPLLDNDMQYLTYLYNNQSLLIKANTITTDVNVTVYAKVNNVNLTYVLQFIPPPHLNISCQSNCLTFDGKAQVYLKAHCLKYCYGISYLWFSHPNISESYAVGLRTENFLIAPFILTRKEYKIELTLENKRTSVFVILINRNFIFNNFTTLNFSCTYNCNPSKPSEKVIFNTVCDGKPCSNEWDNATYYIVRDPKGLFVYGNDINIGVKPIVWFDAFAFKQGDVVIVEAYVGNHMKSEVVTFDSDGRTYSMACLKNCYPIAYSEVETILLIECRPILSCNRNKNIIIWDKVLEYDTINGSGNISIISPNTFKDEAIRTFFATINNFQVSLTVHFIPSPEIRLRCISNCWASDYSKTIVLKAHCYLYCNSYNFTWTFQPNIINIISINGANNELVKIAPRMLNKKSDYLISVNIDGRGGKFNVLRNIFSIRNEITFTCYRNCYLSKPDQTVVLKTMCGSEECPKEVVKSYQVLTPSGLFDYELNSTQADPFFIIHANLYKAHDKISVALKVGDFSKFVVIEYQNNYSYNINCILNCPIAMTEINTRIGVICHPGCLSSTIKWKLDPPLKNVFFIQRNKSILIPANTINEEFNVTAIIDVDEINLTYILEFRPPAIINISCTSNCWVYNVTRMTYLTAKCIKYCKGISFKWYFHPPISVSHVVGHSNESILIPPSQLLRNKYEVVLVTADKRSNVSNHLVNLDVFIKNFTAVSFSCSFNCDPSSPSDYVYLKTTCDGNPCPDEWDFETNYTIYDPRGPFNYNGLHAKKPYVLLLPHVFEPGGTAIVHAKIGNYYRSLTLRFNEDRRIYMITCVFNCPIAYTEKKTILLIKCEKKELSGSCNNNSMSIKWNNGQEYGWINDSSELLVIPQNTFRDRFNITISATVNLCQLQYDLQFIPPPALKLICRSNCWKSNFSKTIILEAQCYINCFKSNFTWTFRPSLPNFHATGPRKGILMIPEKVLFLQNDYLVSLTMNGRGEQLNVLKNMEDITKLFFNITFDCDQNCGHSNPNQDVVLKTLCDGVKCSNGIFENYTVRSQIDSFDYKLNSMQIKPYFVIHANVFQDGDVVTVELKTDSLFKVVVLNYGVERVYNLTCIANCPMAYFENETKVGITCYPNCISSVIFWALHPPIKYKIYHTKREIVLHIKANTVKDKVNVSVEAKIETLNFSYEIKFIPTPIIQIICLSNCWVYDSSHVSELRAQCVQYCYVDEFTWSFEPSITNFALFGPKKANISIHADALGKEAVYEVAVTVNGRSKTSGFLRNMHKKHNLSFNVSFVCHSNCFPPFPDKEVVFKTLCDEEKCPEDVLESYTVQTSSGFFDYNGAVTHRRPYFIIHANVFELGDTVSVKLKTANASKVVKLKYASKDIYKIECVANCPVANTEKDTIISVVSIYNFSSASIKWVSDPPITNIKYQLRNRTILIEAGTVFQVQNTTLNVYIDGLSLSYVLQFIPPPILKIMCISNCWSFDYSKDIFLQSKCIKYCYSDVFTWSFEPSISYVVFSERNKENLTIPAYTLKDYDELRVFLRLNERAEATAVLKNKNKRRDVSNYTLKCIENCPAPTPDRDVILKVMCHDMGCSENATLNFTILTSNANFNHEENVTVITPYLIIHANVFKNGDIFSIKHESSNLSKFVELNFTLKYSYKLKCIYNCPIVYTEKDTVLALECLPSCTSSVIKWKIIPSMKYNVNQRNNESVIITIFSNAVKEEGNVSIIVEVDDVYLLYILQYIPPPVLQPICLRNCWSYNVSEVIFLDAICWKHCFGNFFLWVVRSHGNEVIVTRTKNRVWQIPANTLTNDTYDVFLSLDERGKVLRELRQIKSTLYISFVCYKNCNPTWTDEDVVFQTMCNHSICPEEIKQIYTVRSLNGRNNYRKQTVSKKPFFTIDSNTFEHGDNVAVELNAGNVSYVLKLIYSKRHSTWLNCMENCPIAFTDNKTIIAINCFPNCSESVIRWILMPPIKGVTYLNNNQALLIPAHSVQEEKNVSVAVIINNKKLYYELQYMFRPRAIIICISNCWFFDPTLDILLQAICITDCIDKIEKFEWRIEPPITNFTMSGEKNENLTIPADMVMVDDNKKIIVVLVVNDKNVHRKTLQNINQKRLAMVRKSNIEPHIITAECIENCNPSYENKEVVLKISCNNDECPDNLDIKYEFKTTKTNFNSKTAASFNKPYLTISSHTFEDIDNASVQFQATGSPPYVVKLNYTKNLQFEIKCISNCPVASTNEKTELRLVCSFDCSSSVITWELDPPIKAVIYENNKKTLVIPANTLNKDVKVSMLVYVDGKNQTYAVQYHQSAQSDIIITCIKNCWSFDPSADIFLHAKCLYDCNDDVEYFSWNFEPSITNFVMSGNQNENVTIPANTFVVNDQNIVVHLLVNDEDVDHKSLHAVKKEFEIKCKSNCPVASTNEKTELRLVCSFDCSSSVITWELDPPIKDVIYENNKKTLVIPANALNTDVKVSMLVYVDGINQTYAVQYHQSSQYDIIITCIKNCWSFDPSADIFLHAKCLYDCNDDVEYFSWRFEPSITNSVISGNQNENVTIPANTFVVNDQNIIVHLLVDGQDVDHKSLHAVIKHIITAACVENCDPSYENKEVVLKISCKNQECPDNLDVKYEFKTTKTNFNSKTAAFFNKSYLTISSHTFEDTDNVSVQFQANGSPPYVVKLNYTKNLQFEIKCISNCPVASTNEKTELRLVCSFDCSSSVITWELDPPIKDVIYENNKKTLVIPANTLNEDVKVSMLVYVDGKNQTYAVQYHQSAQSDIIITCIKNCWSFDPSADIFLHAKCLYDCNDDVEYFSWNFEPSITNFVMSGNQNENVTIPANTFVVNDQNIIVHLLVDGQDVDHKSLHAVIKHIITAACVENCDPSYENKEVVLKISCKNQGCPDNLDVKYEFKTTKTNFNSKTAAFFNKSYLTISSHTFEETDNVSVQFQANGSPPYVVKLNYTKNLQFEIKCISNCPVASTNEKTELRLVCSFDCSSSVITWELDPPIKDVIYENNKKTLVIPANTLNKDVKVSMLVCVDNINQTYTVQYHQSAQSDIIITCIKNCWSFDPSADIFLHAKCLYDCNDDVEYFSWNFEPSITNFVMSGNQNENVTIPANTFVVNDQNIIVHLLVDGQDVDHKSLHAVKKEFEIKCISNCPVASTNEKTELRLVCSFDCSSSVITWELDPPIKDVIYENNKKTLVIPANTLNTDVKVSMLIHVDGKNQTYAVQYHQSAQYDIIITCIKNCWSFDPSADIFLHAKCLYDCNDDVEYFSWRFEPSITNFVISGEQNENVTIPANTFVVNDQNIIVHLLVDGQDVDHKSLHAVKKEFEIKCISNCPVASTNEKTELRLVCSFDCSSSVITWILKPPINDVIYENNKTTLVIPANVLNEDVKVSMLVYVDDKNQTYAVQYYQSAQYDIIIMCVKNCWSFDPSADIFLHAKCLYDCNDDVEYFSWRFEPSITNFVISGEQNENVTIPANTFGVNDQNIIVHLLVDGQDVDHKSLHAIVSFTITAVCVVNCDPSDPDKEVVIKTLCDGKECPKNVEINYEFHTANSNIVPGDVLASYSPYTSSSIFKIPPNAFENVTNVTVDVIVKGSPPYFLNLKYTKKVPFEIKCISNCPDAFAENKTILEIECSFDCSKSVIKWELSPAVHYTMIDQKTITILPNTVQDEINVTVTAHIDADVSAYVLYFTVPPILELICIDNCWTFDVKEFVQLQGICVKYCSGAEFDWNIKPPSKSEMIVSGPEAGSFTLQDNALDSDTEYEVSITIGGRGRAVGVLSNKIRTTPHNITFVCHLNCNPSKINQEVTLKIACDGMVCPEDQPFDVTVHPPSGSFNYKRDSSFKKSFFIINPNVFKHGDTVSVKINTTKPIEVVLNFVLTDLYEFTCISNCPVALTEKETIVGIKCLVDCSTTNISWKLNPPIKYNYNQNNKESIVIDANTVTDETNVLITVFFDDKNSTHVVKFLPPPVIEIVCVSNCWNYNDSTRISLKAVCHGHCDSSPYIWSLEPSANFILNGSDNEDLMIPAKTLAGVDEYKVLLSLNGRGNVSSILTKFKKSKPAYKVTFVCHQNCNPTRPDVDTVLKVECNDKACPQDLVNFSVSSSNKNFDKKQATNFAGLFFTINKNVFKVGDTVSVELKVDNITRTVELKYELIGSHKIMCVQNCPKADAEKDTVIQIQCFPNCSLFTIKWNLNPSYKFISNPHSVETIRIPANAVNEEVNVTVTAHINSANLTYINSANLTYIVQFTPPPIIKILCVSNCWNYDVLQNVTLQARCEKYCYGVDFSWNVKPSISNFMVSGRRKQVLTIPSNALQSNDKYEVTVTMNGRGVASGALVKNKEGGGSDSFSLTLTCFQNCNPSKVTEPVILKILCNEKACPKNVKISFRISPQSAHYNEGQYAKQEGENLIILPFAYDIGDLVSVELQADDVSASIEIKYGDLSDNRCTLIPEAGKSGHTLFHMICAFRPDTEVFVFHQMKNISDLGLLLYEGYGVRKANFTLSSGLRTRITVIAPSISFILNITVNVSPIYDLDDTDNNRFYSALIYNHVSSLMNQGKLSEAVQQSLAFLTFLNQIDSVQVRYYITKLLKEMSFHSSKFSALQLVTLLTELGKMEKSYDRFIKNLMGHSLLAAATNAALSANYSPEKLEFFVFFTLKASSLILKSSEEMERAIIVNEVSFDSDYKIYDDRHYKRVSTFYHLRRSTMAVFTAVELSGWLKDTKKKPVPYTSIPNGIISTTQTVNKDDQLIKVKDVESYLQMPKEVKDSFDVSGNSYVHMVSLKPNAFWWHPKSKYLTSDIVMINMYSKDKQVAGVQKDFNLLLYTKTDPIDHSTIKGDLFQESAVHRIRVKSTTTLDLEFLHFGFDYIVYLSSTYPTPIEIKKQGFVVTALSDKFRRLQNVDKDWYVAVGKTKDQNQPIYGIVMEARQCLTFSFDSLTWSHQHCDVGKHLNKSIVHCKCNHFSVFGASYFVPQNDVISLSSLPMRKAFYKSPLVLIVLLIVTLLYIFFMLIAFYLDRRSRSITRIQVLPDNFTEYRNMYIVCVESNMFQDDTTARVILEIHGENDKSERHFLNVRRHLLAGNEDWFAIFTRNELGQLTSVRIFHDSWGLNPNWYCDKITIEHPKSRSIYVFLVRKWFSPLYGTGLTDRTIPLAAKGKLRKGTVRLPYVLRSKFREYHLCSSIFFRFHGSNFSSKERLTVYFVMILLIMALCLLFYSLHSEWDEVGSFAINTQDVIIFLECIVITIPIVISIAMIFRNTLPSKSRNISMKLIK